jgi:N-acetyl-gamma-glutamyl-phosphate reductase/acetylglutamate kinase
LFTDTGAGTLIRRGNKLTTATNISQFEDIEKLKDVLVRDREGLDAKATVDRYVDGLENREFKAYFDEPMDALAIVFPPTAETTLANLATFTITKAGWLTIVAESLSGLSRRTMKILLGSLTKLRAVCLRKGKSCSGTELRMVMRLRSS